MTPVSEAGFVVGGRYANAAGEYEVLTVDGGTVRVRYTRGIEMALPAQGLWAQWEALVAERTGQPAPASRPAAPKAEKSSGASRPSSTKSKEKKATGEAGLHTALGYLAAGCEVTAAVPGRDYMAFAQRYQILTGRNLVTPHAGLDVHERPTHRLGAELSVEFPATAAVLASFTFGSGVKAEPLETSGRYRIKHAKFVEELLRLGFDLGPNTDPWAMREHIPEPYRADFDRGLRLRGGRA